VRDGDVIRLDAVKGTLEALVDAAEWDSAHGRELGDEQRDINGHGLGRELFGGMRRNVLSAEEGACTWL
jgi:phosphogluconate dehydratase